MNTWFYKLNSKVLGPVSQETLLSLLKSGELSNDTIVKNKETEVWREACSFNELFPLEEQCKKKLPVFDTISKAFKVMQEKAPILWKKLFFIAFLLMLTNIMVLTQENIVGTEYIYWGMIALNLIITVMFIVTVHRVVLLEESHVSIAGFSWSGKDWKFVFYSLLFYFLISLTTMIPMLLVTLGGPNVMRLFLLNPATMYISIFFLALIVWYLSARLSLVFPAIAVEKKDIGFGWAMGVSSANGWRLMVILFAVPLLIAYVIPNLYGISLMFNILLELIKILLSIFEIILLSVSFRYLSEFKEQSDAT